MKRGHCSRFAVPHTSISITPLSRGTAPRPSASAAGAAPAPCGTEEVLRDPLFPRSRGCATPREVKQLLQDANLLEAAHGAAAGRDSAHPAGSRDLPQGRASPRRARRSGCSGKVPHQQKGRAGPAQLLLPPPPAHPCGSAAPTGQGWELLPRSIAPGSSSCKERLPSCHCSPSQPHTSLSLRTGALLQPG